MTISVQVSCNGNYKCPVSYRQGQTEHTLVLSGKGKSGPDVVSLPFQHGADAMSVTVGPEEPDND